MILKKLNIRTGEQAVILRTTLERNQSGRFLSIAAFPNGGYLRFSGQNPSGEPVGFQILNETGEVVFSGIVPIPEGYHGGLVLCGEDDNGLILEAGLYHDLKEDVMEQGQVVRFIRITPEGEVTILLEDIMEN